MLDNIINAVSTVGFPIAMCFYVMSTFKKSLDTMADTMQSMKDEVKNSSEISRTLVSLISETRE